MRVFFSYAGAYLHDTQSRQSSFTMFSLVRCDLSLFLEKKSKLAVSNKDKQSGKLWIE